jgi:flagellar basal-body rod protein FlgB
MIGDLANQGAMPALEATLRFAAGRQRLIAGNVANLSTPDYRQLDVSPQHFRERLAEAVEQRRRATGGMHGALEGRSSAELKFGPRGALRLEPVEVGRGILAHDRNNRDLERLMQDQAENAAMFRVATDLLRSRFDLLRTAISERL